jgi:Immunoglobulin-like domain of bacterial spore germination/Sporulation and spore germination
MSTSSLSATVSSRMGAVQDRRGVSRQYLSRPGPFTYRDENGGFDHGAETVMAVDRRSVAIAVLAVLAVTAGGVAVGALMGGARRTAGQPVAPTSTTPAPAGVAGPSLATRVPVPLPTGPAVPVYVLGDTEAGARLYREFRSGGAVAAGDPVRAAVRLLGEPPQDPDYRTPWQQVPVAGLTRSGADVTVRFGDAPRLSHARDSKIAVQQVVHTVTAADTKVKRVRVIAPGLPAELTARPLGRAGQLDVLAPVWLLTPSDGGRAGRRVVLTGTASVFEATVSIEARQGARVVARTFATASVGAPERGEWTATVTLPPGDYVLAAFEASARDGTELSTDTKRVKVA